MFNPLNITALLVLVCVLGLVYRVVTELVRSAIYLHECRQEAMRPNYLSSILSILPLVLMSIDKNKVSGPTGPTGATGPMGYKAKSNAEEDGQQSEVDGEEGSSASP